MLQDSQFVRKQGVSRTGCGITSQLRCSIPAGKAGCGSKTTLQRSWRGELVRKQGVSRTECSRTVVSYENRAFPVPDASGQSVRTKTGLIPYRMPQDSQFVRKQGVSRTGCLRPAGSYGNKAYPVPDAGSPASSVAPFPPKKPVAGAKRPSSDPGGAVSPDRRCGKGSRDPGWVSSYENKVFPVPDAPGQSVRTETGRFPYRMGLEDRFIRKQGLSRTECSRTVSSYGNRAFPVPVKWYCIQK